MAQEDWHKTLLTKYGNSFIIVHLIKLSFDSVTMENSKSLSNISNNVSNSLSDSFDCKSEFQKLRIKNPFRMIIVHININSEIKLNPW